MTAPEDRIFGFWTGDNSMSEVRSECWATFGLSGLHPTLITPANLPEWIVPGYPLHPAYEHLSFVHRSDYLRPYFMHHHGGGYSDIKRQTGSWRPAIERVLRSQRLVGAGYREIRGGTVCLQDDVVEDKVYILSQSVPRFAAKLVTDAMRGFFPIMIGNGAYYFKPRTFYTRLWLREVERRLDLLLPNLKKFPPSHSRDRLAGLPGEAVSGYPVPWSFLLGDINGPLSLIFSARLSRQLPAPEFHDYL